MPTRFEQRFQEKPVTLYPPIPAEKLTPTETPTLDAPIVSETVTETAPVETEPTVEETKKGRRKRRSALNLNNLPEEIVQIRLKWFALYTTALLTLSILGATVFWNSSFIQEQIQNYKYAQEQHRIKETASFNGVMKSWTPPNTQNNLNGSQMNDLQANQFFSSLPYKDLWEFYAKKCGYQALYPGRNFNGQGALGETQFSIQSTDSPGAREAYFSFRDKGILINVLLSQLSPKNITKISVTIAK